MILLIDNYDSFSYNLYQMLGVLEPDIRVVRNDAIDVAEIARLAPSHIVISPGPGRPEDAGICLEAIRSFAGRIPLLGVCLGHQALCQAFGATITYAARLMHGKSSVALLDNGSELFKGLPASISVARYHSLAAAPHTIPPELRVTARTAEGEVMAVEYRAEPLSAESSGNGNGDAAGGAGGRGDGRDISGDTDYGDSGGNGSSVDGRGGVCGATDRTVRAHPAFGVQFHPESILTPQGAHILKNFLNVGKAIDAHRDSAIRQSRTQNDGGECADVDTFSTQNNGTYAYASPPFRGSQGDMPPSSCGSEGGTLLLSRRSQSGMPPSPSSCGLRSNIAGSISTIEP